MADGSPGGPCPHCGAPASVGTYCSSCGQRVRPRAVGETVGRVVAAGCLVLVALPLLLVGGTCVVWGTMGALASGPPAPGQVATMLGVAAIGLGIGVPLLWGAALLLRKASAITMGEERTRFG